MKVNSLDAEYKTTDYNTKTLISNSPLKALLNYLFIKRCSKLHTFDDLVYHCDYSINSKDTFLALPADIPDTCSTYHYSWVEMFGDAVAEHVENQLSY